MVSGVHSNGQRVWRYLTNSIVDGSMISTVFPVHPCQKLSLPETFFLVCTTLTAEADCVLLQRSAFAGAQKLFLALADHFSLISVRKSKHNPRLSAGLLRWYKSQAYDQTVPFFCAQRSIFSTTGLLLSRIWFLHRMIRTMTLLVIAFTALTEGKFLVFCYFFPFHELNQK